MKWIGLGVQIRVGGYLWVGMDEVRTWNVISIFHIVVEIFLISFLQISYAFLMVSMYIYSCKYYSYALLIRSFSHLFQAFV